MEEINEEWSSEYAFEDNGGKVRWRLNRDLAMRLGKQILVAGFVASSVPVVLPPLVVISTVGLALSVPYGLFLASHACTEKLMSKLLPKPPLILDSNVDGEERQDRKEVFFEGDIDIQKAEEELQKQKKREIEMIDAENVNEEGNNMTLGNGSGQGLVKKDGPELSDDTIDVIEGYGFMTDDGDCICQEEKAFPEKPFDVKLENEREDVAAEFMVGESKEEEPIIGANGVPIKIQGLDKIGNHQIEQFMTPFESSSVALEGFGEEATGGDIEEAELEKETRGLLEKIRDECKSDNGGEYTRGIQGKAIETNNQNLGPVVENMEIVFGDRDSCAVGGFEGDARMEEDPKVSEEMLESRHTEYMNLVQDEVESAEPITIRSVLQVKEVDDGIESQKPMVEPCGPLNGRQDNIILAAEDSAKVISEENDAHEHIIVQNEQKPSLDGLPILQEARLENNISIYVNQESQLHGFNEINGIFNADAREIADDSGFDLFVRKSIDTEEYAYYISDLHEESSYAMGDENTNPLELPVLPAENKSRQFEYSSGKAVLSPSNEVTINEEKIWKQIHAIRMIVGYEGTPQASCIDELKALFIFTGVEPPTFPKDFCDCEPSEINDKLHFLMSIVGVKSNVA